jgi:REP element-mobilizing transposase RayT
MPKPRQLIVRRDLADAFSVGVDGRPGQVFHCLSRVVDRNFVFGEVERERFAMVLRAAEAFSGVRVLAWTILSNHFHVLLEVPAKPAGFDLDEDEFWRRIEALYSDEEVEGIRGTLRAFAQAPGGAVGENMALGYRRRFLDRMLDLSEFMKTLKQRFTVWFNTTHERVGTLWESRFKAVLVEGNPETLMKVAAYIDLNAVRAGMVADPKDYRWCGYAEALGARRKRIRELAREAMRVVMGGSFAVNGEGSGEMRAEEWGEKGRLMLAEYRKLLFGVGDETMSGKGGFTQARAEAILEGGGKLTLARWLRCRVRHFSDGLVLGSRAFVDRYFEGAKEDFGSRRTSGARKIRGSGGAGLYTVRDLQSG